MDEYTKSLQPWQFMSDLHLPDVLVFSPATPLFKHHLTLDKKIILMDKVGFPKNDFLFRRILGLWLEVWYLKN